MIIFLLRGGTLLFNSCCSLALHCSRMLKLMVCHEQNMEKGCGYSIFAKINYFSNTIKRFYSVYNQEDIRH